MSAVRNEAARVLKKRTILIQVTVCVILLGLALWLSNGWVNDANQGGLARIVFIATCGAAVAAIIRVFAHRETRLGKPWDLFGKVLGATSAVYVVIATFTFAQHGLV